MIDRRQFLQTSGLISLVPWIPAFIPGSVEAGVARQDGRILVVIQLDGGNDGLNTVIPYTDENYAKHRAELQIDARDVLKLNGSIGLHPGMKDLARLFEDGQFTIVQGVGYPNPNRSHFESMAIWHRARIDSRQSDDDGWLGRAVETVPNRDGADSVYIGDEAIPAALKGRRANAISLEREGDLALRTPFAPSNSPRQPPSRGHALAEFVTRTQIQSFDAARRFEQSTRLDRFTAGYPSTALSRHLQFIARLIKLGAGTRVYYASQGGYDTHVGQVYPHRELLSEFSGAVGAFLGDLKAAQLADRVVVLAFSEFGRRVQENGSAGTDHGAAGPVFLAGSKVHGGFIGDHPSLSDLDDGDLKMSIDFRSIYATILTDWLSIEAASVLGGTYAALELVKA